MATNHTRILIGYDGSEGADAAMDDLLRAGLPSKVEALVVAVAEVGSFVPLASFGQVNQGMPERSVPALEASRRIVAVAALQAERTAAQGAQRLRRLMPGWSVGHAGRHGSPYRVLVDEAHGWGADLLVVGSHGRSPIGRLLLGSVSHFVTEHAGCSVRIGRRARKARIQAGDGARILLGVDGSDGAGAAVEEVLGRVWPAGSEVRLAVAVDLNLCASLGRQGSLGWLIPGSGTESSRVEWPDWPRRLVDPAARALADAGLTVTSVILGGDAKRVLPDEAERWGADCIFLGATGHSRSKRFLLGSVSSAVASRAHYSVEVVRSERWKGPGRASQSAETSGRSALKTREVAEHDWSTFADQFSRLHRGAACDRGDACFRPRRAAERAGCAADRSDGRAGAFRRTQGRYPRRRFAGQTIRARGRPSVSRAGRGAERRRLFGTADRVERRQCDTDPGGAGGTDAAAWVYHRRRDTAAPRGSLVTGA